VGQRLSTVRQVDEGFGEVRRRHNGQDNSRRGSEGFGKLRLVLLSMSSRYGFGTRYGVAAVVRASAARSAWTTLMMPPLDESEANGT